jgi:hypothetical protein
MLFRIVLERKCPAGAESREHPECEPEWANRTATCLAAQHPGSQHES